MSNLLDLWHQKRLKTIRGIIKTNKPPGDSKRPFHPLVGGHLTFPKGHVFTIPKRSPAELPRVFRSKFFQSKDPYFQWDLRCFLPVPRPLKLRPCRLPGGKNSKKGVIMGIILNQGNLRGELMPSLLSQELNYSGQISIIPKPELRGFWGSSLTKPQFRVTSADVVIICPDYFN